MNLYLISQDENREYDTYDAAVVAAPDLEAAASTSPSSGEQIDWRRQAGLAFIDWARHREAVSVQLLAENVDRPAGVVLASFNAG